MAIGFAALYFTYIRKAKFTWRQILQGFVIAWGITAFPVLLLGENSLGAGYLILPIVIGFIVLYVMRRSSEKSSSPSDKDASNILTE